MKSSVELKLDGFFAGDMKEIPLDFSMSMLSKNAQELINSCGLPAQQKEYLMGLSQELNKAYNNSYSYLFLTGYLVGNFSKINRLVNLYHISFRGQGNDFDYLSNMLDMFNPEPVQYPYLQIRKYRHQGKIEEESVLNFPLLFEDTIKTLDAWEFWGEKQLIIKYLFLQMVLLYRTLRQNKIFAAYINKLKLIVSSQEQFINLYFLFSPVYEDSPENTILHFDDKKLNTEDILEILEKNTAIAEQYLIKKIKEYLGFSKKEEILAAQEVVPAHHETYEQSQALFKSYQETGSK